MIQQGVMSPSRWKGGLKIVVFVFIGLLFVGAGLMLSQQQKNVPSRPLIIGIIQYLKVVDSAVDGFKEGLQILGYEEGKDVLYRYESADGNIEKISSIAQQYIAQDVDLIYAVTSVSGRGALRETNALSRQDIPIIFVHADHPVETGLAASTESSENNTTGIAVDLTFLTAKRLEFLLKIKPDITKVGVFYSTYTDPAANFALAELKTQAPKFGMEVVEYVLGSTPGPESTEELRLIVKDIAPKEIDALFLIPGPVLHSTDENIRVLVELSKRLRIPSTSMVTPHAKEGILFSYAHDLFAIGVQSARMADKIFRGVRPSDIPLEVPEKHILAVNLKTAKDIGIQLPESLLELADIKIE